MERSLKRMRIGPSHFDCDSDDELNSHPEEVNLRRDPGYQLQKSRSVSALKLKSRFEDIFAKYEKDFTGVGDEILLSTGEIAVNNGHLESLKDQRFDDVEDEDEVEEEERILQGKLDNPLSLAQTPLPLTLQPRAPVFPAQWQPQAHFTGGSPMLTGAMHPGQMPAMYPGQMPFFPPPISLSFDPVWNAPALPMPTFGNPFGPMAPAPPIELRKPLIAPANADDEDDILLGVTTKDGTSEQENVPASSQPRPEKPVTTMALFRRPPEPPKTNRSRLKRVSKTPLDPTVTASPVTRSNPSTRSKSRRGPRKSGGKGKERDLDTSSPAKVAEKPTNQRLHVEIRVMKKSDASSYMKITPEPNLDAQPTETTPQVNNEAVCLAAETMVVEKGLPSLPLPATKDEQVAPSPVEPKEKGSKQTGRCPLTSPQVNSEAVRPAAETMDVERGLPSPPLPAAKDEQVVPSPEPKEKGSTQKAQCPSPPAEVFSRNTLDPDYAFSDEDEPTLSKARVERQRPVTCQRYGLASQPAARKQRRKAKKPSSAVKSSLHSISEDADDTVMADEVTEEKPEQLETVADTHVEVAEEEPDTDDTVMADEVAEEEPERLETVAEIQVEVTGPELETVTESHVEVAEKEPEQQEQQEMVAGSQVEMTEKEPEQPEMVMESQALPTVDMPTFDIPNFDIQTFDLPSPMASDPACPPTSSPTRSKVERRATGHISLTPEPTNPSSDQTPSSPSATPFEEHPTTIPDPDLPTSRRKRKLPPTSEHPSPRRPSPFSSPGRIPRDQTIPETPDASSSAAIPHHSPRHRSPSPELGLRDPITTTLTLNPKQPAPAPQTPPSSKSTPRRVPRSGSILSLVDDDNSDADKDELAPSPRPSQRTQRASTPRTRTRVSQSGASVRSLHTPSTNRKSQHAALRRLAATVGRRSRSSSLVRTSGREDRGGVVSSPLAPRSRGTPAVEVVQTPGGTKRRCGEGGWRCERDFCFVCF